MIAEMMKYNYGNLYFRYGDLFPDNFPEKESVDMEERERMLGIRKRMFDESESLRKSLSNPNGNYIIGNDLKRPMLFDFTNYTDFRKWLGENNLLFGDKQYCQMVIDKMLEIL